MQKVKIVFPEIQNEIIKEAISRAKQKYGENFEPVGADSLENACAAINARLADAMIAGIDYTSREVILACRDRIGMADRSPEKFDERTGRKLHKTFSASFLMTKDQDDDQAELNEFVSGNTMYIIGDAAACKHPTTDQLYDIVLQTYGTARAIFEDAKASGRIDDAAPRLAMLSFSTIGSGGTDDTIMAIHDVLGRVKNEHPEIVIDGELQLDAAVNPLVAKKKAPASKVAGRANVLIVPDLNSGNILYKSMEQFGGFTAAGPILQGFAVPVSDLSRGSTIADVLSVIDVMMIQVAARNGGKNV